jgi:para-nitrobenzyl esterase
MQKFLIAAVVSVAAAVVAVPAVSQPGSSTHYSTAKTPLGTLLADPAARAAIAHRFPVLLQSKSVTSGMANRMTLQSLKHFKPEVFTDAALTAIDADFARIPGR